MAEFETERFFRLLVESVQEYAIIGLDPEGRIAGWNEGAERIKGYTAAEILGQPYAVFFPPEAVAEGKPQRLLERAATAGRVEDEGWRVRKDGTRFWADAVLTALRDERGQLLGFAKITRDLTERRRAQQQAEQLLREQVAREAAEASLQRLELLAEASGALAASLDPEVAPQRVAELAVPALADFCAVDLVVGGRLERLAAFRRDGRRAVPAEPVTAWPREEWIPGTLKRLDPIPAPPSDAPAGHPYAALRRLGLARALVAPLHIDGALRGALTFARAGTSPDFEPGDLTLAEELATRTGVAIQTSELIEALRASRRDLEEQAAELEEQAAELEEQTEQLQELARDLEAQVEVAEQARTEAEEANRAKTRFLAAMSHELRTPLNGIAGHADLLALGIHGALTPEQARAIERIQRNEQRLLALINDILGYARLEAGKLSFQRHRVAVTELLADVRELAEPLAREHGLEFDLIEPTDPRLAVVADPDKAARILRNLADNAVKYTPAGGRIEVETRAQRTVVSISVRDNGRGIPPDRLASIFEPFVQVDQELTREQGGLGLGLAISRELARGMDGDVTVGSEPGAGSTFTLTLPRARDSGVGAG